MALAEGCLDLKIIIICITYYKQINDKTYVILLTFVKSHGLSECNYF